MHDNTGYTCPNCAETLYPKDWKNTQLDVCDAGCQGIWFDADELQAVEQSDSLTALDAAFEGAYVRKPLGESLEQDPERKCPRDSQVLDRYEWNVGSGIVFDSCPQCHGLWLDAGELEGYADMVKRFRENPPQMTPEIAAKLQASTQQARRDYEAVLDEATKTAIRWDLGCLDDMLRGLVKVVIR